ncbi:7414_t:CDS:1, partial [Cetraspora pellucida]
MNCETSSHIKNNYTDFAEISFHAKDNYADFTFQPNEYVADVLSIVENASETNMSEDDNSIVSVIKEDKPDNSLLKEIYTGQTFILFE